MFDFVNANYRAVERQIQRLKIEKSLDVTYLGIRGSREKWDEDSLMLKILIKVLRNLTIVKFKKIYISKLINYWFSFFHITNKFTLQNIYVILSNLCKILLLVIHSNHEMKIFRSFNIFKLVLDFQRFRVLRCLLLKIMYIIPVEIQHLSDSVSVRFFYWRFTRRFDVFKNLHIISMFVDFIESYLFQLTFLQHFLLLFI